MTLTHLDLFSGIGGFALAAKWAGFTTVAFCEIEPYCQKVLRKNFGATIVIHDDIRKLDGKQYAGTVDLLTGGFPCQPFSIAGKRRGTADDRNLWPEMFRVIRECRPTWVVGENVANFVNMELDNVCADLENEGYEVQPFIIPAASVGAPHKRERVLIVAYSPCLGWRGWGHGNEEGCEGALQTARSGAIQESKLLANDERGIFQGVIGWQQKTVGFANGDWWAVEPGVGRVANGIPHRVDRLRGLGNAVVPQQVYPILAAIAELL